MHVQVQVMSEMRPSGIIYGPMILDENSKNLTVNRG